MNKFKDPAKDQSIDIVSKFFQDRIEVQSLLKKYDTAEMHAFGFRNKCSQIDKEISYNTNLTTKMMNWGAPDVGYMPSNIAHDSSPNSTGYVIGIINKIISQLCSLLLDPASAWLGLDIGVFSAIDFSNSKAVDKWLKNISQYLYRLFRDPTRKFYTSTFNIINDDYRYGLGCREVNLVNNKPFFNAVDPTQISAELSGFGDIETVFRTHSLKARQAIELWGNSVSNVGGMGLHQRVLEAASSDVETTFNFVEICMPNIYAAELQKMEIQSARYLNIVIDKSDSWLVYVGLQNYKSYIVSRFNVNSGELFGGSPVWDGMRDIMLINMLTVLALENIEYIVNPPIAIQNAMSLCVDRIAPRSVIPALNPLTNNLEVAPFNYTGDPSILTPFLQMEMQNLNQILLANDLLLPDSGGARTREEILQRKAQATYRIRPMIVRFEQEDLSPTIMTVLNMLSSSLPKFPYEEVGQELDINPEELAGLLPVPFQQLNICFNGQLSKMQKLQDLMDAQQVLQTTMQTTQIEPSVRYQINIPNFVKMLIREYDFDPSIINSDEYVSDMMDRDAQAAQQQAQVQQLQIEKMQLENQQIQLKNRELAQEIGL
jgi:hypothetical protein